MDGEEEEEENGHRYAKMAGKTDGGRDIEEAARRTQEHMNHHMYWVWKSSELMHSLLASCACG